MLYKGLPDSAICKRDSPEDALWGPTEELLAQLVEEVSVLVADRRRKEPRTIPRPYDKKQPAQQPVVRHEDGGLTASGLGGMLSATQMRGAVRLGD